MEEMTVAVSDEESARNSVMRKSREWRLEHPGAKGDEGGHNAENEIGMTTAELLGNAALGVLALVAIWAALQQLGLDIVDWVREQVLSQS